MNQSHRAGFTNRVGKPAQAREARGGIPGRTDCLAVADGGSPELRASAAGAQVRGVMARTIYLNESPRGAAPAPAADTAPAAAEGEPVAIVIGLCVARSEWAGADAFVRADKGTDGERDALARLRPHLAACVPEGVTLTIDKPLLRMGLSVALYKLSAGAAGS